MPGVERVTTPMKPTRTPPIGLTKVGAKIGWPV
jgi:hypothetical protein